MTEPSQYFKGRTVQEQMNEVIGYVDARAEEVAAAKADDVLEPAEQAKDDAIAAKEAAEQARDTTLAALPQIQQDITDLKAEDVALDGRLDTVELKVQTAEGNIVTIQGRVTALETADGQNVKLTGEHAIGNYAVLLTGNQEKLGVMTFKTAVDLDTTTGNAWRGYGRIIDKKWESSEDLPTSNSTIRLVELSGPSGYFLRLNAVLATDGKVRIQYETEDLTNGVRTYRQGYLS